MTDAADRRLAVWLDAELTREACTELLVQLRMLTMSAQALEIEIDLWLAMLPPKVPPVRLEIEPLTRAQAMSEVTDASHDRTPRRRLAAAFAFRDLVRTTRIGDA